MNDRSRWIALVVLCTGMLMIVLDMTIVNVALPTIQADLGFSQAGLAWVVNAYLIAFAGLLLLAGRLGDLAGRRDVFLAGLAIFTVASMACGLAVNQEMLIVARFAQGTGGALSVSYREPGQEANEATVEGHQGQSRPGTRPRRRRSPRPPAQGAAATRSGRRCGRQASPA